jgi:predicted dehydrogenase
MGAAPLILPSRLFGGQAPSQQITLGFIGVGSHGLGYNLANFLTENDCRAVAVCDVFADRRQRAREVVDTHYGTGDCRTYADFRELLARDDIDAVVISTPDHWHVPLSLLALAAGKDVFCEKPTLTIAQGRQLANEVKKHDAVFQTGLEDRSLTPYHMLAEAVRNGAIGQLETIEVGLPFKKTHIFPAEDPTPVPKDLNYNMWLGEAPFAPYSPMRTHKDCWRQVRDYSGGTLTDWGAHIMDTAQVGNFAEHSGPVAVEGEGEIPPKAPQVAGWRGPLEAHDRDIFRREYENNKIWPLPPGEHRNFLDCVRSRMATTYTAEALHRLSTVMHIGNIATELGRKLKWDPESESFGDPEADRLRSRAARTDWATG